MTKNAAVNFAYHCHCFHYFFAIVNLSKTVAVIAKVDCRVFCHINCLGDKISNTAAPINIYKNFQNSARSLRLIIPKFKHESLKRMSFIYNGSKIINHLLECDIPYFGLISIPVFKSRLKRHLLFMQSKSRSGDEDWLQCNHDIFSDITL